MKKIPLLLACCLSMATSAQDWAPFPFGSSLYYADSSSSPVTAELYLMDSVRTEGSEQLQFFNRQAWRAALGDCAATLSDPWGAFTAGWPTDSLIIRNDTIFQYTAYGSLPFLFLPQATVGQSWVVATDFPGNAYDTITVTCAVLEQRTFLGITDSVKVFTMAPNGASDGQVPISSYEIVLSKAHGLVEFIPFTQFLNHPPSVQYRPLSLIGMDGANGTAGFTKPGFTDFFHLHPGDVLIWEYKDYPGDISQPWTHIYARDSITGSLITGDSVRYHLYRRQYQWNGVLDTVLNLSYTGYRSQYQYLVDIGPTAVTVPHTSGGVDPYFPVGGLGQAFFATSAYSVEEVPGAPSPVLSWSYGITGHWLNTEICGPTEMVDLGYGARLDTRAGANFVDWSDVIGNIRKWALIGSVIDGVPDGDLTLGVDEGSVTAHDLRVYPNPVRDRLSIQAGPDAISPFVITDAMGRVVLRGQTDGNGIAVEQLPKGPYLLRMQVGGQSMTARFVKE